MTSHRGSPALIRLLVVAGLAVVGLALSGCGDSDDDLMSTESSDTTTTATTIATSTSSTVHTTTETSASRRAAVNVYFGFGDGTDCSQVKAFPRSIAIDDDAMVAAFEQLVAGPTDEEASLGAGSFFSAETSEIIRSFDESDGLLMVDFIDLRTLLPNASTSCGSAALLAQLNSTAFQFDVIERTRFEIDGSCELFGNWLQRDCFETDRTGSWPSTDDANNLEGASGSGCTPNVTDGLPAGRWFGFVSEAEADHISFDLACWFSGAAAIRAAAEDGEESPPPNDYHIRNTNERIRIIVVDSAAEVSWLSVPADPASLAVVTYETWLTSRGSRSFQPGIWLNVADGQVASIEEQYVP